MSAALVPVPPLRVAFAGTPEFARVALRALLAEGWSVPLVLTQPDRPAGRGMKLQPSPVKAEALAAGIPVAQPRSLRLDGKFPEDARAAADALAAAAPDAMVVAAYGLLLPEWVLALPRLGCLNLHASLLPRWRGAAPIHRAIEAGDDRTGITVMQMDAGLDTGAMLSVAEVPIAPDDTTATLHDRLAALGGALIGPALRDAAAGRLQPRPQPDEGVTYAHKIDKAESAIDWRASAATLERRLRAFDPFPGASTLCAGELTKVWRGAVLPGHPSAAPGTVLEAADDRLVVACGDGALRLLELQRPGGRRVPARAWLQSSGVAPGTVFGV